MNHLAMEIAFREGEKSQVNIAQIKEILKTLAVIFKQDPWEFRGLKGTYTSAFIEYSIKQRK